MEKTIVELLEEAKKQNDELAGLEEDGPIRYLVMDADDFNIMTIDELLSAAAALNCLSFQVQRFQSDNEASANRLERYINKSASIEAGKYEGYWEERRNKAITGSERLTQLDRELSQLKHKAEQHKYLATSINQLANTLNKKADIKSRKWRE